MAEVGNFCRHHVRQLAAGRGRSGSDPQRTWDTRLTVYEDPQVNDWESYTGKYVLVVTSHPPGRGDLPDSIVPLY
ncbi:flavoprotein YqcA [Klebsiella pneumoniae]|uniref:Flavoprotein YqcA n=1 Tax=Klebsiella pneumoniae TaxID=573 RepID=A0A447RPS6_KLEPN|nr:flavoprotein YqcA [Klebsiella pneumoniae]